jgi:hypothetical protein
LTASKDVNEIQKKLISVIEKACEVSATSAISKANSIVYANAKYATENFRSSIVKSNAVYNGNNVKISIRFAPTNVRSNKGKVYAQPLDLGHRLVYFGKETGKHVEGKFFSGPAKQTGKTVLESILSEV